MNLDKKNVEKGTGSNAKKLAIEKKTCNLMVNIGGFLLLLGNNCLEKLKVIEILYKPGEPPLFSTGDDSDVVDLELERGTIACRCSQSIPAFTTVSLDGGWCGSKFSKIVEPSVKLIEIKGSQSAMRSFPR